MTVGIDAEAHASKGDDVGRIGRVRLELGPQAMDVGVEGARVRQVAVRPQQVDEIVAGADPPGRCERDGEEVELPARQEPDDGDGWAGACTRRTAA